MIGGLYEELQGTQNELGVDEDVEEAEGWVLGYIVLQNVRKI